MELLEGIQKLAPWLGQLPTAHKVALTVAVLALASFVIAILWIPIRPDFTGQRQERNGDVLTIIVNASGAAADATNQFLQQIDSSAGQKGFSNDAEREQLKNVIHQLVSIEHSQAPLPWLLRRYAEQSDPGNWDQVKDVILMNAPKIQNLQDFLGKFNGELIARDLGTYKQLYNMTEERSGLYNELSKMPPPTSPGDKKKLLKIADNFDRLIAQIKIVQNKLARYLDN